MRIRRVLVSRALAAGLTRQAFILTMKLNHLLQQRSTLLRQTRLANVAFVFAELVRFADRIDRGKLRGQVTLHLVSPTDRLECPTLVADEGSQAVIDEHFLDRDILDLADLLAFASGEELGNTMTFRLEEFGHRFLPALQEELEAAGIEVTRDTEVTEDRQHE